MDLFPRLNKNQVEALASLVNSHMVLGHTWVGNGSLHDISASLKECLVKVTTGIHDMGNGDYTFSLFHNGNKIACIKTIREATGLGLKEAKDIADKAHVVIEGSYKGCHQLVFQNSTREFFDYLTSACKHTATSTNAFTNAEMFTKLAVTEVLP